MGKKEHRTEIIYENLPEGPKKDSIILDEERSELKLPTRFIPGETSCIEVWHGLGYPTDRVTLQGELNMLQKLRQDGSATKQDLVMIKEIKNHFIILDN